ncbi:MAG: rod shape-determining protein MreD [Gammaproteobacteria bacterium]
MNDTESSRDGWLILATFLGAIILDKVALPQPLTLFRPDLLTTVVICWSLLAPRLAGVGIAWLAGLMVDVAGGGLLGLGALVLSLQAYLCLMLYQQVRVLPRFQQVFFVLLVMALAGLLEVAILSAAGKLPALSFWYSLPASVLSWPLIYGLMMRWRLPS